jgi:hypothetical protein
MAENKTTTRRRKKSTADTAAVAPVKAEAAKDVVSIAPDHSKGVATDAKYVKIVAIETVKGSYGGFRFTIEDGKTYSFPAEISQWLISCGRAK